MKLIIVAAAVTLLIATVGEVRAANELDGKALLCNNKYETAHPVIGLSFDDGKVSRHEVTGYSKTVKYQRTYWLVGTHGVNWVGNISLNRETLRTNAGYQCSLSSKEEMNKKLDEIIATAKKKNKI